MTGVQTCALPISSTASASAVASRPMRRVLSLSSQSPFQKVRETKTLILKAPAASTFLACCVLENENGMHRETSRGFLASPRARRARRSGEPEPISRGAGAARGSARGSGSLKTAHTSGLGADPHPPGAERRGSEWSPSAPPPSAPDPSDPSVHVHVAARGSGQLGTPSSVVTWGSGQLGTLGHGEWSAAQPPRVVSALEGRGVACLDAAWGQCVAVTHDGCVYRWGWRPNLRSLMVAGRVAEAAPALVTAMQSVPLGTVTFRGGHNAPQKIEPFGQPGLRAVAARAGAEHTMVLTEEGRVYTWGSGVHGQLGHSTLMRHSISFQPKLVTAIADFKVVKIAAGASHSVALTGQHSALPWVDCDCTCSPDS